MTELGTNLSSGISAWQIMTPPFLAMEVTPPVLCLLEIALLIIFISLCTVHALFPFHI